jgi:hypothetical protein
MKPSKMAKKKFITCFCSDVGKPKKSSFMNETSIYSDKCECRVGGKRITKHGRDDVVVELVKSKRKGYEWS